MPAARPDKPAPMMIVSYTVLLLCGDCFYYLLLLDHIFHPRLKVSDGAGEAGEVLIVLFRNLNAVALAQFHDDVEKVHAVELELLAEGLFGDEARKVFVWGDVGQDIEDFLADFSGGHGEYFLMITTELIPSIPNELFKMYSVRFRRRGSPMISVVNAHSGSSSSTLIV